VLQFARAPPGALYDDSTLEEALMRRLFSTAWKAALVCASGSALAQSGDLSSVTMRVLDDVADIDAVILELDANRGAGEEGADGDPRRTSGDEADDNADRDAEQAPSERAEEDDLVERRAGDELHDPDEDERSEGKLEDNDVERPAVPPVP
jgi:hypothetical protein